MCTGASTRNSAWVKSRPTFTPTSPGRGAQGVLVGGVVAGEEHGRGSGGLAQEVDAFALGRVDHGGFQHAFAVLQEDARAVLQRGAGGGHGVLGDVVRGQPGVQHDAGGLVLQQGAGCLLHDLFQDAADVGEQFPLVVIEGQLGGARAQPGFGAVAADQQGLLRRARRPPAGCPGRGRR